MKFLPSVAAALVAFGASQTSAYEATGWRAEAAERLPVEYKSVREAHWSQSISLWVTVGDDGSRRDGYAEAICLFLKDVGKPAGEFVAITIWDPHKMLAGDLKELGANQCTL